MQVKFDKICFTIIGIQDTLKQNNNSTDIFLQYKHIQHTTSVILLVFMDALKGIITFFDNFVVDAISGLAVAGWHAKSGSVVQ